jgi:hypothetical protein
MDRVYDWVWFQRQKDHAGIDQPLVAYIPLTPYSALPVVPLTPLPPLAAKRCWLMLSLLLLAASGYLLWRMTSLSARRITLLILLAIVPLRANFLDGQQHVLVLFLIACAAWLYLAGWTLSAGATLAVASVLKVYPALFLVYFLRKRQWRAIAGLLGGGLGLGLLGLKLFGYRALEVYLVEVLPWALHGEANDPYRIAWNSPTALLRRLLVAEPEWNPHPLRHLPALYAIVQPFIQSLLFVPCLGLLTPRAVPPAREALEFAGFTVLLLILSTNPASYHFCVLILGVVLAANYLLKTGQRNQARWLIGFYALACFPLSRLTPPSPSGWRIFLGFPRLYALLALWLLLLRAMANGRAPAHVPRRSGFALLFLVLWAGGTWSNLRHLRHQFANYAHRLVTQPGRVLAAYPAAADAQVLFTAMETYGYALRGWPSDSPVHRPQGIDAFYPTLASGHPEAWVELAGVTSRIVRFPRRAAEIATGTLPVEAESAEQPVVSPDARWLAFLREERGRGSLWVKALDAGGATEAGRERLLLEASNDVRDFAFLPDDRLVVAAQRGGASRLALVTLTSPHLVEIAARAPARYPAVSPDGSRLAYSAQEKGHWQLWTLLLATGQQRQLTTADCNSLTPAWLDSQTLVYATDCGRALGQTALCRIQVGP